MSKLPVNTTLDEELKREMESSGLSFSTALTLGAQELLQKRSEGATSREQLKNLRAAFSALATAAREKGVDVTEVLDAQRRLP